ncbi:SDR family NAD(P)-dependent oxidoreductase [Shinella fusca]|uniref:3-oxoacyl-[acyl-carrier protein] reductase n=1 Tax=Shinella fusca TaxID=544480 RepID=A0A7W7YU08_9HYPH|nr:SDR family NAD(P)-dependent oxidoreductase [Shinella fusca]MBB5042226.1 3-oxoacyl-[acyl-carrier protein] reductase [Shinella fusca]
MNQIDLSGQHAVVTGGGQGLGYAMARRMAASGARVTLWDIDGPLARDAAASLGGGSIAVDVTDHAAVEAAMKASEDISGPVSIVVNSAGIAGPAAPLDAYDVAMWKAIIDVNLHGTFHVCRAAVPGMKARGYGRIVNIASIAGKEGNPNASAYSASKAAVIGLTKSLGKELAGYDIAVNAITPATAETRILEQLTPEFIEYMRGKIPRGRFLDVEEAAAMVAWLVSKENSFTTGAVFDLSGGRATY